MKDLWLMNAIGDVDADLVERAATPPPARARRTVKWTAAVAAVLVLVVSVGVLFGGDLNDKPPVTPDISVSDVSQTTTDTDSTTATTPTASSTATSATQDTTTTTKNTTTVTTTTVATTTTATTATVDSSTAAPPTTTSPTQTDTVELAEYALQQSYEIVNKQLIYDGYTDGMSGYYSRVLPTFLEGASDTNRVCSPLSVYLALAMLAETAAGNSRQQILNLLGEQDTEVLIEKIPALWNSVYSNRNSAQCLLANSIWLNQSFSDSFSPETVERLAFSYYASVFRGVMGTVEYNRALREWINQNTGDLLKEQANREVFSSDGVFSLVNTIYFNVKWADGFNEKSTSEDEFKTQSSSGIVKCDFMTDTTKDTYYWEAEEFTAITRPMYGNYSMWFILPDEEVSVDALLQSGDVLGMITGEGGGAERINCDLVTKVPKFDVSYNKDLVSDIKSLGVTDMFDRQTADLTTLLGENSRGKVSVSAISHAVRVITKETGVEAAAFTHIGSIMGGTSPTTTRKLPLIYFTADRPFMFAITNSDGSILFAGVISNPNLN